jgi:ADP-dependent NAD(P)H-hydrate dehydratase / NAD(P)H-hydrate epimerase
MKIVSVEQMRNLDYRTINEAGISGKELMRRAGVGAGERILEYMANKNPLHFKRFVILAGKGNNAGDAYVVAKYLKERTSSEIIVYSVCQIDELKGAAKYYAEHLTGDVHISIKHMLKSQHFRRGDIIIDGLLGTGFENGLKEPYHSWIKLVNRLHLPVIALDIPSGLNGSDGSVESDALLCDLTITMGMPKAGLVEGEGPVYCGRIKNVDLGIPLEYRNEIEAEMSMFTGHDAYYLIDRLYMGSHKKTFGSILVIGGSKLYPGAPFLTGKAALRMGGGVVVVAVPESSKAYGPGVFSLILRRIKDDGCGFFNRSSVSELLDLAEKADVVVIGPGMSDNDCCGEMLKELLKIKKPMVVDADALNLIAKNPEYLPGNKTNTVFTPHQGEIKRLFSGYGLDFESCANRLEIARKLSGTLHGTVIYKGNRTITVSAGELPCLNGSGGPALATAGSGDVLSGIVAANIGAGMNLYDAASLGVYLHGVAGEIGDKGARGLIADDIVELVPVAIKRASPFA